MIGATPLAATPDGSAVLVDTQGGLIGVYPGGHAFVTVSQIPSGLDGGAISPDGNTVVFAAEGGLFQDSTVDGTPTRILLHSGPGFSLSQPVWSPDGTRIAYVRTRASGSVLELLDMATGRSTALLDDAVFGTWSPDGSVLAVLRPAAGGLAQPC
jgi:WD40 repeat protein